MQEQKEFRCKMVCKKKFAEYLGVRTSVIITESSREQQRPSIQSQILWAVISVSAWRNEKKKAMSSGLCFPIKKQGGGGGGAGA